MNEEWKDLSYKTAHPKDDGFMFNGTDITDLGLEYVPELADTYVYSPAETIVHDETFEGHDGGYYYGAWKQPKEFTLRCYFSEKRINMGIMARIHQVFKVGQSGKLVFKRRPWCYYNARVIESVLPEFTNYLNGIITIRMKAYFPFARSDVMFCERNDPHYDEVMSNTAFFNKKEMIPPTSFKNITNSNLTLPILLANPGTEVTPVAISIAGDVGMGITITNTTTKQKCSFVKITKELTPAASRAYEQDARVVCDGLNGKTVLIDNAGLVYPGYLYHHEGFISLEPSFPVVRGIFANISNGNILETTNILESNYVGQYIYLGSNGWCRIVTQPDKHTLVINKNVSPLEIQTTIMRMNEITITPVGSFDLTKLEFGYKPAFG